MKFWPDADRRGKNGGTSTWGAYTRIPLGELTGGWGGTATSPKTTEGTKRRAVVWLPEDPSPGIPVVLWYHGFSVGVRSRGGLHTDVEFYQLDRQLALVPPCAVVLPQGGMTGPFGTAQTDPLGYLLELEGLLGRTFGQVIVAAHSGGGEAAIRVLPMLGTRLGGVLLFEAINGNGQKRDFKAWALGSSTAGARAVYGAGSSYYAPRHRELTTELVSVAPRVRMVPVTASHEHVMAVGGIFATSLKEVLGG